MNTAKKFYKLAQDELERNIRSYITAIELEIAQCAGRGEFSLIYSINIKDKEIIKSIKRYFKVCGFKVSGSWNNMDIYDIKINWKHPKHILLKNI